MEYRILGPLELVRDGESVTLGPKPRTLLAVFLLHPNEVVSTDRLADELWGDGHPASAPKLVQLYVSQLRKALGDVVVTRAPGYLIRVETDELDAARFQLLLAEARLAAEQEPGKASELYAAALAIWRGRALADVAFESFAANEVERLDAMRQTALEERFDVELALGHSRELVPELEAVVAEQPLRERPRAQLMLALYRSGRRADALELYRETRRFMVNELGLEPGEELKALERAILHDDPGLATPTNGQPDGPSPGAPVGAAVDEAPEGGRFPWRLVAIAIAALAIAGAVGGVMVALGNGSSGNATVEPNSVAAIDPASGRIATAVPVGARPAALAYGPGGLWVANLDDGTVSHVDPRTGRVVRTISVGPALTDIASGAGRVWVTTAPLGRPLVALRPINPQYDELGSGKRLPGSPWGGDAQIAFGAHSAWLAFAADVAEVNPRTEKVGPRIETGTAPSAVAFGFGAVWVSDFEADNLVRVDAQTKSVSTTIPVGRGPSGVAVGDGSVWVAESLDDTVRRIDPATNATTAVVHVGRSPVGLAVADGKVWVANSGDGTVAEIDAHANRVEKTVRVGDQPAAVVAGAGRIWVSVQGAVSAPLAGRGTLRVDYPPGLVSLDPALEGDALARYVLYSTCAKPVNYPDKGGPAGTRVVPEVAQALPRRSADGKAYTFTIRSGFRFSPPSNAPVTAQTFKASIERNLNPAFRNPDVFFFPIVGLGTFEKGTSKHISGLVVDGNRLTVRLTRVVPDLPARMASLGLACAVPTGTPVDPRGLRLIPSAGPYYVASYVPGSGIVLKRNPNYRGSRPRRFREIAITLGVGDAQAVADLETGRADYAQVSREQALRLAPAFGPRSKAARAGREQLYAEPTLTVVYVAMNTSRPLFRGARLRRAVNYAIDRRALAQYGWGNGGLPTDQYLPPGVPGYRRLDIYPRTPDVARAQRLARGRGKAVLYACNRSDCVKDARLVQANLRAIGIDVIVKTGSIEWLYSRLYKRAEPYDLAVVGWAVDYLDPADFLNTQLTGSALRGGGFDLNAARFDDRRYNRRLAQASRLYGARRYRVYARIDSDLTRFAAPWAPFANEVDHDFFSRRIGCQVAPPLLGGAIDFGALCLRPSHQSAAQRAH